MPPVCRCSSGWLTLVCIIKRRGVEPERETGEARETREKRRREKKMANELQREGGGGERDCLPKKSEKAKE